MILAQSIPLDKPALWLLDSYGPLALGWVLAFILLAILIMAIRWFLAEQRDWRAVSEARSQAYHEVVRQNTETTVRQSVVFEERTREILEYVRNTRARR